MSDSKWKELRPEQKFVAIQIAVRTIQFLKQVWDSTSQQEQSLVKQGVELVDNAVAAAEKFDLVDDD